MPNESRKSSRFTKKATAGPPPLIGALLRVPYEGVREHILNRLRTAGFGDIDQAHFNVFQYPGPEGRRPSEVTAHARVSKQAMNYLLNQLEERGYFERRPDPDDARSKRIVLTRKGEAVRRTIRDAVAELEREWETRLGARRFAMLKRLLQELYDARMQAAPPLADSRRRGA